VRRRLILALSGWRHSAGVWPWYGLLCVSEEQLDAMTDGAFEAFVTSWQTRAVSALWWGGRMSKKDRSTWQPIAGALVEYMWRTYGVDKVWPRTAADGRQFFRWLGRSRDNPSLPAVLPCQMPVEVFAHFEGVHEWHVEGAAPSGQQGELF
jgi:hypothetical protein